MAVGSRPKKMHMTQSHLLLSQSSRERDFSPPLDQEEAGFEKVSLLWCLKYQRLPLVSIFQVIGLRQFPVEYPVKDPHPSMKSH